ncbi:hypothetical protein HPB50_027727 [Hyalomma asiaticum]|nr:hypothetical protein HPB50_027727 [Hyalomma asiaticum]
MGRDGPVPKRPRVCEVPHKEQCKKPARARQRAMHEGFEQNTKYTLLPDSDDEALQTAATITKKKTSKKHHLPQKADGESDEERPTASISGEGVEVKQEPNWDSDPEDERLRGLKERDEFAARLHDQDKVKTRNIVERFDKKVFVEAAKRLKPEAEGRQKLLPKLRVESMCQYLEKRKEDKLVELEANIHDEQFLFSDVNQISLFLLRSAA